MMRNLLTLRPTRGNVLRMTTTQSTEFTRTFNTARSEQGFRSQAHLDAFYAHYDHTNTCTDCHPGSVLLDDGWQGTLVECDAAVALYLASVSA